MKPGRRLAFAVICLGLLFSYPGHAHAHLVSTGFGPFYDGMGHLALSPEYWIPALALALFAGLRGRAAARKVVLTQPAAWIAGGIGGMYFPAPSPFPLSACLLLMVGLLVASDIYVQPQRLGVISIILGFALGWMHGAAMQIGGGKWPALLGAAVPIFIAVVLVSAFVISLERAWMRIGVRTVGSWMAALGLLLIGWSLRPEKPFLH